MDIPKRLQLLLIRQTFNLTQVEQRNKDIVVAMTDAFNTRNVTALDNLIAQDIIENRPGVGQGIEATKGFLASLMQAFPDFITEIEHIIAEGDLVVVFTNTTGTHEGEFIFAPGVRPTGEEISFRAADLYRIEDGKIAEHWDVIEILDMLAKMGTISFNRPQQT
jgi:predicted ester cyclase